MKNTSTICDRCRGAIVDGASALEVVAGDLRRTLPDAIDLCRDCGEDFASWVRSGRAELPGLVLSAEPAGARR